MKFCIHCGSEIPDDSSFCPNCGSAQNSEGRSKASGRPSSMYDDPLSSGSGAGSPAAGTGTTTGNGLGLKNAAKVFMIISCALCALNALTSLVGGGIVGSIIVQIYASAGINASGMGGIYAILSICQLIPLSWQIPMTVIYFRKTKNGEPVSVGFKVCVLIFVSLISGILMLCDSQD